MMRTHDNQIEGAARDKADVSQLLLVNKLRPTQMIAWQFSETTNELKGSDSTLSIPLLRARLHNFSSYRGEDNRAFLGLDTVTKLNRV